MIHPSNHYYGDVSNLNAPYDAIAVQGVGAVTFEGKTLPAVGYPWMEESNDTLLLQGRLNPELAAIDKCPLLLDGRMGPRTCGALFLLDHVSVPDGAVQTCSIHAGEAMEPKSCPGGVVPGQPAAPEPSPVQTKEKAGGIPIWVWGVGLGVLAIGAAMMLKKKKR